MSAKKPHGLTTLEMQAQNIVKEEDDEDVYINDTEKYNAMVESRKERRAVSLNFLYVDCLWTDFQHRSSFVSNI